MGEQNVQHRAALFLKHLSQPLGDGGLDVTRMLDHPRVGAPRRSGDSE